MRKLILLALLAGAQPAFAQQSTNQSPTIIVTGIRLQDYRAALAACLARHCPVNEDVDASLALAEALFINGDYHDARTAVRQSIGRNRDAARAFPEPVADLFRANARIDRHLGMDNEALRSTYSTLHTLRDGIAQEDYRHFTARLELSEMLMRSGNLVGARRELAQLARNARAADREDVAILAELKSLWFDSLNVEASNSRSQLIAYSRLTDPADRMRATGARILLAFLYRAEGRAAEADALIASVGASSAHGAHRALIRSPSYQLQTQEWFVPPMSSMAEFVSYGDTLHRLPENYEGKWMDVGFWVLPDGHVSGLEVVRQGAPTSWANPLLDAIRGRLYSAAPEATYRLERYTYTAELSDQTTGSRLPQRSPHARVEYFDLSTEQAPPTPPAAAAPSSPAARFIAG